MKDAKESIQTNIGEFKEQLPSLSEFKQNIPSISEIKQNIPSISEIRQNIPSISTIRQNIPDVKGIIANVQQPTQIEPQIKAALESLNNGKKLVISLEPGVASAP